MYDLAAQAVGFVAMALCILCFQCKSSRNLVLMQFAGNFIYILHYLMLGAYSGCLSMVLLSCSNALICLHGKTWAEWKGWKWILCIAFAITCAVTWESAFSLLPCGASIVAILANWSYNGKTIRLTKILLVGPGWIGYNVHVLSYSGIICEAIGICSAFISICRYGMKELDKVG